VFAPDGTRERRGARARAGARGAAREGARGVVQLESGAGRSRSPRSCPPRQRARSAIVSLARLVPLLEVELPNESSLLAVVDGDGRVLARAGKPPGGARSNRST
jgi:hypothetical protein